MTKTEFNKLCQDGKYSHIPVIRSLPADLETPLSVYLKLANLPYSFLFESALGGEKWGRYSIIGLPARKIISVDKNQIKVIENGKNIEIIKNQNPLDWLDNYQQQFKLPKIDELKIMPGGLVGYFGYETISYIEKNFKNDKIDDLKTPDILLMQTQQLAIFDNLQGKLNLITLVEAKQKNYQQAIDELDKLQQKLEQPLKNTRLKTADFNNTFEHYTKKPDFINWVKKTRQDIINGEIMQVVLSQKFKCDFKIDELYLYRAMRQINPSPHMYYLDFDDFKIVGSSPEILVRLKNNKVTVRPIAGTRRRGVNVDEDKKLAQELLDDPKEIAEHLMLIDLGRNDIGRVAKISSVKLTEKMIIEKYSHVMHIVSNVQGEIKDNKSAIDVLKATYPAGTVSGAPKVRAMQIIDEHEKYKRGIYSGAVGYLGFDGSMDTAIAIRTAIIKNKKLYMQAGAGLVYDSDPKLEYQETINKAAVVFDAVALAHKGLR
ncbi:MAG: anthranilate synthase component I [Gammaproteobacteria bacterium]|nr:MAG: anthranilate synthase component I [Gammaproteobacteria bacterium]